MKINQILVLVIALVFVFAMTAEAQWGQQAPSVTQSVGNNGAVNWSNQIIQATGIGAGNPNQPLHAQRAMAIRAAKVDAWRNLLESIKGVSLSSETTVRNAMVESDVIQTKVEGILKGFSQVGEPKYLSDGSVEVTVQIPLTGALTDAILPSNFGGGQLMSGGQPLCPTCGQPWPAGKPVPPGVNLVQPSGYNTGSGAVYTGLIVNAKGLNVRPAMAPKVVDENGNEIYGSKFVDRKWAVEMGMVGYDKDVNRARSNDRVTANPLIVNAIKTSGPNKADLVISANDAAAIHSAAANQNFLDKCKVMFVVD